MKPKRLRSGKRARRPGRSQRRAGSEPRETALKAIARPVSVRSAAQLRIGQAPSGSVKKVSAAEPASKIPGILLEGDRASLPGLTGPEARFGGEPSVSPGPEPGELPEAYGTGRLTLTARDPHCLRAHWDLTSEQQRHYNALSANGHLVLRLYFEPPAGSPMAELQLHPDSSHWFIHVARAGRGYAAELGYYQVDRQWRTIAASDTVQTPPETLAQEKTVRFATIPWERRPGPEDTPSSRPAAATPMPPPPFVTRQLRFETAGPSSPMPPAAALPPELKRPAESSPMSWDQPERGISSQTPIQLEFVAPVPVSLSSPIEAGPPGEKGFFLNINAELIIYGATAPDAQVSLAGRPIRLRPDGTFSYRFALPDGKYELAVSALSHQGELRQAELSFSRDTRYQGEVGPHTQEPALQPPPGHVG